MVFSCAFGPNENPVLGAGGELNEVEVPVPPKSPPGLFAVPAAWVLPGAVPICPNNEPPFCSPPAAEVFPNSVGAGAED